MSTKPTEIIDRGLLSRAAEQAAPGCVVTQRGEFLMALKVPQKEGK